MPTKSHGRGHGVRLAKNQCFACGPDNPAGMHLKFTFDQQRQKFVCRFRLDQRYTGPPGHCHGGIIAAILDEAMGKVNKLRNVIALTKQMSIDYLRPVPLNQSLRVESHEVSVRGRRHVNTGEILNQKGEVLARGRAVFIAVDPRRFEKFVNK
ncbi:MAG: PaaI family thioesterase [Terriglobales bacterium]